TGGADGPQRAELLRVGHGVVASPSGWTGGRSFHEGISRASGLRENAGGAWRGAVRRGQKGGGSGAALRSFGFETRGSCALRLPGKNGEGGDRSAGVCGTKASTICAGTAWECSRKLLLRSDAVETRPGIGEKCGGLAAG